MKWIILLAVAASMSFAQTKYLHVSTIPAKADIFVGKEIPDYSKDPDFKSPCFIPANDSQILLGIFHPEFADSLIQVNLSSKDTSYLIVSLKPSYDELLQENNEKILSKRSQRKWGKRLMFSSILPFTISAVGTSITLYQISEANHWKKIIKNSHIAEGDSYNKAKKNFSNAKDKAETAKTTAIVTSTIGALLLTTGFIISF